MPAWSEFQDRLRRYVGRRVDGAAAEDVAGDVLLKLLEHQRKLAEARDPLAWAYRVAANVIADHHRRRAAEVRALERAGMESRAAVVAPAEEDGTEARRRLQACLLPFTRDLPPKYAEALVLTSFEGLSQVEAARRLGLSVSGMKSRVQRARQLLKQRLMACCDFQRDSLGRVIEMRPPGPVPDP